MSARPMVDPDQHHAAVDVAFALGMRGALELQRAGVDLSTIEASAEEKLKAAMAKMRAWWFR